MSSDRKWIRIESNGTDLDTHITVDGVPIEGVKSVTWHIDAADQPGIGTRAVVTLKVEGAVVDLAGQAESQ